MAIKFTNSISEKDLIHMRVALEEAKSAGERGEVPVGAVIVDSATGEVVARNGNRSIERKDPSAHAEMVVIREACEKLGQQRIPECDLYVTLEPCTMCAGAISFARIRKIIYGAADTKGGAIKNGVRFFEQPTCHHKIECLEGVIADDCSRILKEFFKGKR